MPSEIMLVFADSEGTTVQRGPYASFCLQGETMRERAGGDVIAVHEDHRWVIGGHEFIRVDCDCRVKVELHRVDGMQSKKYGAFESFSCVDGLAYVDHSLFAVADRSIGDWYCRDDGQHWAIITVEAVD